MKKYFMLPGTEIYVGHVTGCRRRNPPPGEICPPSARPTVDRQAVLRVFCTPRWKSKSSYQFEDDFFPIWWPSGGPNELYRVLGIKGDAGGNTVAWGWGKGDKIRRKFPLGVSFFFISFFHSLFSSVPTFFSPFHSFPIFTLIVWLLYLLHLLSYLFPLALCCSLFLVASCTFYSYVLLQAALNVSAATHMFRHLSCHHQDLEMSCGFILSFYSVLYYSRLRLFSFVSVLCGRRKNVAIEILISFHI